MKKSILFLSSVLILILATGIQTRAQECYTCPEHNNNVTGVAASALGRDNTVNGNSSSAIGNNNTLYSGSSFIAGTYSNINSSSGNSVIIGGSNTMLNGSSESYIFGSGSEAQHSRSMLIGHRLKSGASNQIILGAGIVGGFLTCDKMHSLAVGFKSAVPTFFVSATPYNFESGRVGIGNNTEPQAKLHIKADVGEDATLLIEATGTNKTSSLMLSGGPAVIGTTSNSNSLSFVTGNTNSRMFIDGDNGNVGIGSDDPVAKLQVKDGDIYIEDINRGIIMKSPDGNCWRGVLNNLGQLEFILLPDCFPTSVSSQDMDQKLGFNIIPNPASGSLQIRCTAEDMGKFTTYKLFDSSGKQLKEGALNQTSTRVDIQNLNSGMYVLAFFGDGAFWTEKVVVE